HGADAHQSQADPGELLAAGTVQVGIRGLGGREPAQAAQPDPRQRSRAVVDLAETARADVAQSRSGAA
ncbi:hypothetical protein ABTL30_20280, partial [Acinetobacter baumannii]